MSIATRVYGLWRNVVGHGRLSERELDRKRVRHGRRGTLLDTMVQDIRYGARTLARTPAFTTAAVIALALGIGANAAIFSVVDAVILRPLPYENPDRLAVVLHDDDGPVSPANFADWRDQSRSFESMGAAEYWTPNMTGVDEPEKLWALHVTPSIFPILGIAPLVGRTFLAEEGESGAEHEVVLGYSLWQRRFGGDLGIVGESITLDGARYTVVGVMPRDFRFAPFWATKAELWAPLVVDAAKGREASSLRVFARLAPGVSLRQAQAEMATVTARLEREYPGTNRGITVRSLKEKVDRDHRPRREGAALPLGHLAPDGRGLRPGAGASRIGHRCKRRARGRRARIHGGDQAQPLRRGRDVAESDNLDAPAVGMVNEFLANRYWPGEDPIGKRITLDDPERDSVSWLTVVGVAKNAVRGEWAASEHEEIYLPFLQNRSYLEGSGAHVAYQTLVIRTSGEAAALAAVGIYGVMSYSVSRRTHEIGLRMALGAQPGDVVRIVVGQAMALAIIGASVGLVGALALGRFMSSFLYGVQPSDPLTFLAMAVILGTVALAASYIPARRATRIDPLLALRQE